MVKACVSLSCIYIAYFAAVVVMYIAVIVLDILA